MTLGIKGLDNTSNSSAVVASRLEKALFGEELDRVNSNVPS